MSSRGKNSKRFSPQITQITQIEKLSHEKAQEAQKGKSPIPISFCASCAFLWLVFFSICVICVICGQCLFLLNPHAIRFTSAKSLRVIHLFRFCRRLAELPWRGRASEVR